MAESINLVDALIGQTAQVLSDIWPAALSDRRFNETIADLERRYRRTLTENGVKLRGRKQGE